jgi:hypothetical protein
MGKNQYNIFISTKDFFTTTIWNNMQRNETNSQNVLGLYMDILDMTA